MEGVQSEKLLGCGSEGLCTVVDGAWEEVAQGEAGEAGMCE